MSEKRCGYAYEAGATSGLGGVCCWRETWNDTGRCIWHADVGQKPTPELRSAAPEIGERLDGAILRDVELSGAGWLSGKVLDGAQFSNCNLADADLSDTDLRYAHFEGVDGRRADFENANLEHAEFDRTDLRGANLERAWLHYAVFSNARIDERTEFGDEIVYEEQLEAAADPSLELYEAARWTYRELQRLAANNGLASISQQHYLRERDLRWREAWEFGNYPSAVFREGWRVTTGYGSDPWRVIATSAFVIVVCAVLYPTTGGILETFEGTSSGTPWKSRPCPSGSISSPCSARASTSARHVRHAGVRRHPAHR
jgi:hypothetical protein